MALGEGVFFTAILSKVVESLSWYSHANAPNACSAHLGICFLRIVWMMCRHIMRILVATSVEKS